jgi:hypothetical protein
MFHPVVRYHLPHHLSRSLSVKGLHLLRNHPVLRSEPLLLVAFLINLVCGAAAVALHRAIELVAHLSR